MTGESLVLKQKALRTACKKMTAPKEIASFLDAGIVAALLMAGRDEDDEVRELTTAAMARISREPNGREKLLLRDAPKLMLRLVLGLRTQLLLSPSELPAAVAESAPATCSPETE